MERVVAGGEEGGKVLLEAITGGGGAGLVLEEDGRCEFFHPLLFGLRFRDEGLRLRVEDGGLLLVCHFRVGCKAVHRSLASDTHS